MNIRPIHTKADYKAALKAVSVLVDADPKRGTPDGDRLEILGTLLDAYEAKHYPIELKTLLDMTTCEDWSLKMIQIMGSEFIKRWKVALSSHLGRSASQLIDHGLELTDFPKTGVRITFDDGSLVHFKHAFIVGLENLTGPTVVSGRVAIFSEHCGYHEFWVSPHDHIEKVA